MKNLLPPVIQAIGLACVPVHDMPPTEPALARRPVAAAVITLRTRLDRGHEIVARRVADATETEPSLPWLIDQALVTGAPTIITDTDRATLSVDAIGRRLWTEPKLAALCDGADAIDPCRLPGGKVSDEAALCRRLQIPTAQVRDTDVEWARSRRASRAAEDVALGIAAARLMLWAHATSFASGEPDAFFETLLAMRAWMLTAEMTSPTLKPAARSGPIARAASFAGTYHNYRAARDRGDLAVVWDPFEADPFPG